VALSKIKAWSVSAYHTYVQCPAKLKYQKIDKLPEPAAEPMSRGSIIHKQAENFIKGLPTPKLDKMLPILMAHKGYPDDSLYNGLPKSSMYRAGVMPPELLKFAKDLKALRDRFKKKSLLTLVEDEWAFAVNWVRSEWFGRDTWVRLKLDLAFEEKDGVLYIDDWKTGKYRDDQNIAYVEQLELYALGGFLVYEHVQEIRPRLRYIDLGFTYPDDAGHTLVYKRADVPKLKKAWEKRVKPMMADTVFAPKPNRFCGYCHFRKSNGGPCAY